MIDGRDLEGREWDYAADDQGKVNNISVNVNFTVSQEVIDKYSLTPEQIEQYKSAVSTGFNNMLNQSTNCIVSGQVTFNGGDSKTTGQIIPMLNMVTSVIRTDGVSVERGTRANDASAAIDGRFGLKSPEDFATDAIHELLHTLRMEHPFEITQTEDTKLVLGGVKEINWYGNNMVVQMLSSTNTTDKNIKNNIMNYPMLYIDGVQLKDFNFNMVTPGQLLFMINEIDLQKNGAGLNPNGTGLEYWLNAPGTPVSK